MTIRTTKRVETLLSNKKINTESNDYKAYGRTIPGHTPPLFGQQYKFGKAEAVKLSENIFRALAHVSPSHLADRTLFDFALGASATWPTETSDPSIHPSFVE